MQAQADGRDLGPFATALTEEASPVVAMLWRRRRFWTTFYVRKVGNWADAEDLFGELVLRACGLTERPYADQPEREALWLQDLARAVLWNWRRARQRREKTQAAAVGHRVAGAEFDLADEAADPRADTAAAALDALAAAALEEQLQAVPVRQRRILRQMIAGLGIRGIARARKWSFRRAAEEVALARAALLSRLPSEQAKELLEALAQNQRGAARRTRTLLAARTRNSAADDRLDD